MEIQILQAFEEIKKEARTGEVKSGRDNRIIRILFNIVEDEISNEIPNMYIQDKDNFNKLLIEYVKKSLKFYELANTHGNIKMVLSFLFSNITNSEMNNLNDYLVKYINFLDDTLLIDQNGEKNTTLGILKYEVDKQSIQQETPYCFKSYFRG